MANVSFTPSFTHTPWVDNRDRVQAAGPNGFNVRFAALQADLGSLAGVVQQIDTALDALEAGPGAQTRVVTQAPVLSPISGAGAWVHGRPGQRVPQRRPDLAVRYRARRAAQPASRCPACA